MGRWRTPQAQCGRSLPRRLDRLLGEVNTFLIALTIGLSVLDLTCFAASRMLEGLGPTLAGAALLQPTQDTATAADFQ